MYRHPKTHQERAVSTGVDIDEPPVRAKRNFKNLVSDFDDMSRTYYKNWKKYRRTQYRPVAV